ncbi:MAG: hypothetical protein HGA99_06345 [Chlorobiaceae bacterium]|nr:hypothetical protein [Chlorobiaceae bacterium]
MSKSQIACSIDPEECSIVRVKTSGSDGYCLSGCKTFPFGSNTLASPKSERLWKKLSEEAARWPGEDLALSVEPRAYLPLPASFPLEATPEAARAYCRIEAAYFLTRPEEYLCDITGYADGNVTNTTLAKQLLLFYPAEPLRKVTGYFTPNHPINFSGSTQPPLLYLSKLNGKTQVILELEENHILFAIAKSGQMERFSYRRVKNLEESRYFSMKELVDNPVCRETEVQVTGKLADRSMIKLIRKESSVSMKPLGIPSSISISNPDKCRFSSASAVKAISTALMTLDGKR